MAARRTQQAPTKKKPSAASKAHDEIRAMPSLDERWKVWRKELDEMYPDDVLTLGVVYEGSALSRHVDTLPHVDAQFLLQQMPGRDEPIRLDVLAKFERDAVQRMIETSRERRQFHCTFSIEPLERGVPLIRDVPALLDALAARLMRRPGVKAARDSARPETTIVITWTPMAS